MNAYSKKEDPAQGPHDWHSPAYVAEWIQLREKDATQEQKAKQENELKHFLHAVQTSPRQPARVLDLGCGWGRYIKAALQSVPGSTAIAADYSEAMLEAAKASLAGYDERVQFHRLDVTQPGFLRQLDGEFDVVVCVQTLHHFDSATLLEIHRQIIRVLAPGGVFLNIDRVARPPHLAARLAYRLAGSFPPAVTSSGNIRRIDRLALDFDRLLSGRPGSAEQNKKDVSLAEHVDAMRSAGYSVSWKPLTPQRFVLIGHCQADPGG